MPSSATGATTLFDAGGEGGGLALGAPKQPPYPRITAQRLDGVPWKYPLVPLKIGVFQEIRENVLTGKPYQAHGWFIARQNPIDQLAGSRQNDRGVWQTGFHRHGQHHSQ